MQLRKAFVTVLAVFILAGGALAPRCQATPLIGFTDNSPTGLASFLSNTFIKYGSWTQMVPSANTTIGAIVKSIGPGTGHAWLMDQVGSGTTAANMLAETDFSAPVISDELNLSTAPYTTLFTGLSLTPGNYYLVLEGPADFVFSPYQWLGDFTGVGVNTASGFTVGPYGFTSAPAAFPPASNFSSFPDFTTSFLFYRVEGTAVPAPGTLLLLGSGLVTMFSWRRKFQK